MAGALKALADLSRLHAEHAALETDADGGVCRAIAEAWHRVAASVPDDLLREHSGKSLLLRSFLRNRADGDRAGGAAEDCFMDPGDRDWRVAWDGLATFIRCRKLGDGRDLAQRNDAGEVWEYMGSTRDARGDLHTFRHRGHPATGDRAYAHVVVHRPAP